MEYFIVSHGGQIETFLSKDVTHIFDDGNKDSLKQNTGTIPDAFKNTRGGNILSASLTAKKFHDNVCQKCRALGICKLTTAELQKRVKVCDCQALHQAGQKKANVNNQHQQNEKICTWVKRLKPPFIRIDDNSGLYPPMILEFPEWPTINYDSKPPSCPFDNPYKVKIAKQAKVKVKSQKTGYCECCKVKFTNNHLKSKEHTEFSNNPENYKELDEIIKKKPFEKYKEEVKAKYSKT